MACSTDFKNLHDLYQSEGVSKGLSIVHFCQMNGIVYKHYERWYKNYHTGKIIPVEIVFGDGLSEVSFVFLMFFSYICVNERVAEWH